jgi:uncharacterized phiE125 gp8 family phage protein
MSLKLITPPTAWPVTLAEAKLANRFDATDLDSDITDMIKDATRLVEHESGICLMPQTWELSLDHWPNAMWLTRTPVASVTSVKYTDLEGVVQTLAPSAYTVSTTDAYGPARITPSYNTCWPLARCQPDAVVARFVAGFADAASVPSQLKRQVKIFVAMLIDDPMSLIDRLAAIDKVWSA